MYWLMAMWDDIFSNSVQVVVQRPLTLNNFACEAVGGLVPAAPVLLAVAADQPSVLSDAQRIADEALRQLGSLTPVTTAAAPCHGENRGPIGCLAHRTASCRRVLVVVGDAGPISDPSGALAFWNNEITQGHQEFELIPIAHQAVVPGFAAALKTFLNRDVLVREWTMNPTEVVAEILRIAGVTPPEHRVFISYRREDGDKHADVLFEVLTHRGFDVFLDRVRLHAGADLLERITEELHHKSIVLVLETPFIFKSPWVEQEVAYAQTNRMGILAVQFPGGANVRNISPQKRILLSANDIDPQNMLKRNASHLIAEEVIALHDHWLTTRRRTMQAAVWNALLYHNVRQIKTTQGGLVEAQTTSRFVVGVSSRAAELPDFQPVYAEKPGKAPIRTAALIAPGALHRGVRQTHMRWLAGAIGVPLYDEALIDDVATRIEQGSTL